MRYMNLYLSASIPQLETFLAVKKVIDEWDPCICFHLRRWTNMSMKFT